MLVRDFPLLLEGPAEGDPWFGMPPREVALCHMVFPLVPVTVPIAPLV